MPRTLSDPQYEVLLSMLCEVRKQKGITQGVLAEALGFKQTDISKIERGVRRLDVLELRAWVHALEVEFVGFVGDLDERLAAIEIRQQAGRSLTG